MFDIGSERSRLSSVVYLWVLGFPGHEKLKILPALMLELEFNRGSQRDK